MNVEHYVGNSVNCVTKDKLKNEERKRRYSNNSYFPNYLDTTYVLTYLSTYLII